MKDEAPRIDKRLNGIDERLNTLEGLLRVLVKQRQSNKFEKLMDEAKRKGRLTSRQVGDFLGIKRPYALEHMKGLGKELGFVFRVGDATTPSTITFNESLIVQQQNKEIQKLLSKKNELTLFDIISYFNVELQEAKIISNNFVDYSNGKYILAGNKIMRRVKK